MVIPKANVGDLMLHKDVVKAVESGQFHLWAIEHADEGIELLCGVSVGQLDENGEYPHDSVHGIVQQKLENKAKKDGARFVIIADASADQLEGATQFAANFTTMRAKVNLKVVAASNYQLVAEAAESFSGLDAVQDIAVQKALTGACENAAGQVAEQIMNAVNSAKTFKFTVNDVKTIERLEKLQTILRTLPEVEEFSLTKYNNSNATFDVQANVKSSEEFSAKIIRKYYANFGIQAVGADYVEMQFL